MRGNPKESESPHLTSGRVKNLFLGIWFLTPAHPKTLKFGDPTVDSLLARENQGNKSEHYGRDLRKPAWKPDPAISWSGAMCTVGD